MYCFRKITDDLYWVGGNDRRLERFENIFPIPNGVTYNSYLLLDEKTVLFDTVDTAIGRQFCSGYLGNFGLFCGKGRYFECVSSFE